MVSIIIASRVDQYLQKTIDDREVEESLDRLIKEGRFRTVYR